MQVNKVGQENNSSHNVLKAGAVGALAGAVVRNAAPLTTNEHNMYFNPSAKAGIEQKVKKVRINEIEKIGKEFRENKLNISDEVFDTFSRHKDVIADEPLSALDYVKNASNTVKEGVKTLVDRVNSVGAAKQQIEVSNIKSAAKSARPLAFFIAAGALIAMSGQVIINAFNSCMPKEEKPEEEEKAPLTMADILLEGLGTNTEVLFLTNEAIKK